MICFWPGFALVILIWFQFWFWYGSKLCFDVAQKCDFRFFGGFVWWRQESPQNRNKIVSKPYQYHLKTTRAHEKLAKSMSLGCFCPFFEANPSEPYQNQITFISKRIKTVSKLYQNYIKTIKTFKKSTKSLSRGCFCFLGWNQPTGNLEKGAPFPNHVKTISKSWQNHIEVITPNLKRINFISWNYIKSIFESLTDAWIWFPRGILNCQNLQMFEMSKDCWCKTNNKDKKEAIAAAQQLPQRFFNDWIGVM